MVPVKERFFRDTTICIKEGNFSALQVCYCSVLLQQVGLKHCSCSPSGLWLDFHFCSYDVDSSWVISIEIQDTNVVCITHGWGLLRLNSQQIPLVTLNCFSALIWICINSPRSHISSGLHARTLLRHVIDFFSMFSSQRGCLSCLTAWALT